MNFHTFNHWFHFSIQIIGIHLIINHIITLMYLRPDLVHPKDQLRYWVPPIWTFWTFLEVVSMTKMINLDLLEHKMKRVDCWIHYSNWLGWRKMSNLITFMMLVKNIMIHMSMTMEITWRDTKIMWNLQGRKLFLKEYPNGSQASKFHLQASSR